MFKRLIKFLASGHLPFYLLPVLMIYVTAGTIAQRYMGLYAAQNMFFNNLILWVGKFPLPGTPLILAVLTLGLFIKFFFYSRWAWQRTGIHLTHLGVLLLLAGGALMAASHTEGYMQLAHNQTNNVVEDYHQRMLFIKTPQKTLTIPFEVLNQTAFGVPFKLSITETCTDCQIVRRATPLANGHGMAKAVELQENTALINNKPDEERIYGVVLNVQGLNKNQNGTYLAFDVLPQKLVFAVKNKFYEIWLGRATRILPFEITLNKFEKLTYPNSQKARDYVSDVTVHDGSQNWPSVISMNQPLRYKNYTVYQSSFVQDENGQNQTVLSATYNAYWWAPYVGTAIMALGLLIHSILALWHRGRS